MIQFGRENGPQWVRCPLCGVSPVPHQCETISPPTKKEQ